MISDRLWIALQEDHWLCFFIALAIYGVFRAPIKNATSLFYAGVLRFMHKGKYGRGGSARFLGLVEEWQMQWRPHVAEPLGKAGKWFRAMQDFSLPERGYGLLMGRSLYNRFLQVELKDDRHMITIAGTRGGKGISAIIPNLLTFEGSVLCIDPKGENAKITARHRRDMGQDVHIVDPFHLVTKYPACFNPLEDLDPNRLTIREELSVIADALVVPNPNTTDPHWEKGARFLLEGLMAQLITDGKYSGKYGDIPTLSMIRDLLALPSKEWTELLLDMRDNRKAGDGARDVAARIVRGIETDEMANIISNADSHSVWLSYPTMRAILGETTFRFAELKEKPTTIYLVIPPEYLKQHLRFLRLFINMALTEMPKGGPSKIPVLMILDEFLQLGKMDEVTHAFKLLAGYNFTVWPFVQDLGSMKEIYKESANTFFANCRAVQVFSPGMDEATLKLASDMIGNRSLHFIDGMDSERYVALRDNKEVGQEVERDTGMQYILRGGKPAIILERIKFFEDTPAKGFRKYFSMAFWARWLPLSARVRLYPLLGRYDAL